MNVLVVGSGGREHALVWRLLQSPSTGTLVAAPGNAGIASLVRCEDVSAEDIEGLVHLAKMERSDLVVVGPELPLTLGLADRMREEGISCFGPDADGARLEGSKAWAKDLMTRAGIPTAAHRTFTDFTEAETWLQEGSGPIVVKASGLAAGKGAIVCADHQEAISVVRGMLQENRFGEAGHTVVIEECLEGEEASILALTDGETLLLLVPSQDHKRALDGDGGPNTGGMGAYAPAPVADAEVLDKVRTRILAPLLAAFRSDGIDYRGILYAGLMIDESGDPWVIEFNCRFGDPEAQVILPLVEGDLTKALKEAADGDLDPDALQIAAGAAVCVVLASGGYPGPYQKGYLIEGLDAFEGDEDLVVFHAGTARTAGGVVTAGGRVLGVTARGTDIRHATKRAYEGVGRITFQDVHFRTDIAHRALR